MPSKTLTTLPAHNIDAERTVIGALLIDAEAIFQVAGRLRPEDFYDPTYRAIYDAMRSLMEEGTAIDFVTVSVRMEHAGTLERIGGSPFLAGITADIPTASHIGHHADIILEKSRRRQLADIGKNLSALVEDEKKSADELVEMAERMFLNLARPVSDAVPTALADLRQERYEHYVALYEADDSVVLNTVRTGFAGLDEKLTSLAPGQLIVLAGRPGMGKTALALDIATNVAVAQRKTVAIFSLEMSREEVFDRLFAARLGVGAWKLGKGLLTSEQFGAMGPVLDAFADYPLFVDDDANSDLLNIRSKARRHQLQHGLDLLIIDYLQLIEVTDRSAGENQTQRITFISKSLKRLARELHCPVLALSQLSRECERRPNKQPQLGDLRDSGSIEQDGDKILMLYREGEYDPDCENPNTTDLLIRKNRNGPTGQVELFFDKERMSFRESGVSRKPG